MNTQPLLDAVANLTGKVRALFIEVEDWTCVKLLMPENASWICVAITNQRGATVGWRLLVTRRLNGWRGPILTPERARDELRTWLNSQQAGTVEASQDFASLLGIAGKRQERVTA